MTALTTTAPGRPMPAPSGDYRTARAAARRRRALEWIAVHALAIVAAIFFAGPFFFLFVTSVMPADQAFSGALWPSHWVWSNFRTTWDYGGFLTWYRNTLVYAGCAMVLTVCSSVPVAYALAKFKFRFRRLALVVLVSAMMIPPQVTVMPLYLLWSQHTSFNGTLVPLIVPSAFGDAYSIFLLRQFLLTVPKDYLDAARMDGCGEVRTLLRVVVPMIRPAIAAVALFQFFYSWNDYFGPQVYTGTNPGSWTLALGLDTFHGVHSVDWNMMMAANLMAMAPIVVIFFFAQRAFVEGVTLTGVKG